MQHLNNNKLVVIDIRVTSPDTGVGEIIQLSALALDSNCEPDRNILPFNMYIQPIQIRNIKNKQYDSIGKGSGKILVNADLMNKALKEGHDQWKVGELFGHWFRSLELNYNHRIMPLSHNWQFKMPFLKDFFGPLNFEHYFDWRYRDPIPAAIFLNDRCDIIGERCPFPKQDFKYLHTLQNIERHPLKDALLDCISLAQVYKSMLRTFGGITQHSQDEESSLPQEST